MGSLSPLTGSLSPLTGSLSPYGVIVTPHRVTVTPQGHPMGTPEWAMRDSRAACRDGTGAGTALSPPVTPCGVTSGLPVTPHWVGRGGGGVTYIKATIGVPPDVTDVPGGGGERGETPPVTPL